MSTRKFPLHIKPFKHKIVDHLPFTVHTRHKTVKSEMFAFIFKPTFLKTGFEPVTPWLQAMCATTAPLIKLATQFNQNWYTMCCNVTLLREAGFEVFVMQANSNLIYTSINVVALDTFICVSSSVKSVLRFSSKASSFFFTSSGSTSSVVFSFT